MSRGENVFFLEILESIITKGLNLNEELSSGTDGIGWNSLKIFFFDKWKKKKLYTQ